MKKKKIFIFTIVSIISSMFIGLNCDAASRAYSVGTKWPAGTYGAGSDFATNVKNAANAYGKLSGYSSYYNTNPTYSYMKGTRLGSSQIYFINGHASATHIDVVSKDEDNYRTGISIYGEGNGMCDATGDAWVYAGLEGRSMTGTKLITFAGCKTGNGSNNLVTKAVAQGAKAAVGFKENVTSRFNDGPNWMKKYNTSLGSGSTIQNAISAAVRMYPNMDLSAYVTSSGNTSIKLGTLASKSANYANNLKVMSADEREFLKPTEELYNVITLDNKIEMKLKYEDTKISKSTNLIDKLDDNFKKVVEIIKNYDSSFDLKEYKVTYNLVNRNEGNGYIFFTYFINNMIETNKVYLVEIRNSKVENITLAGVKKTNTNKVLSISASKLSEKIFNFESEEKEKVLIHKKHDIFNTQNVLTKEKKIDKSQLKENIEEFNEKYYYDYNTNKLSYMLTTYVETPNQTTTGEFVEVTIE